MQEEEHDESEGGPEPSDLDEEAIEDVAFQREVRGCEMGRVRLRCGTVGGCSGVRFEKGEE